MKRSLLPSLLLAIAATIGCGGTGSSNQSLSQNSSGSVFVTGEDAPASSVVGFNVSIDKITLNNGSSTAIALSTSEAVDFARLMGLRTLLGFNTIPKGTYDSVTFVFENSNPAPVISYIDLTTNPPSVKTITGSFTQSTVTIPFSAAAPLVVSANGLAGVRIDFNVGDSLQTSGGQITGIINPVINVAAVSASEEVGEISDFTGNVVSVTTSTNSFLMQGPCGMPRTIDVNSNTQYNGSNSLGTLTQNAVVSVIGRMQADGSMLAKYVEVITTDKAFVSGRVLAANPTSGPVTSVTMVIGEKVGTSGVLPVDTVQTINLSGVTKYDICFFDNFLTNQLFNNTSLVVGQRIFIGGTVSGGVFTPGFVSLRRQGVVGALVSGSVTVTGGTGSNLGYFQMQNDALMSYSVGGAFTVYTGNATTFENIGGLAGLATAGTPNLIARGLVFKDSTTLKPVVVAGRVRVLPPQQ
jgi:hypothetical protein